MHVPVPDDEGRRKIFEVHTRNKPIADDVDLNWLASRTDGYVGADIEAVCREASMAASRGFIDSVHPDEIDDSVGNVRVSREHFEEALQEVGPSVDQETKERYEDVQSEIGHEAPGEDEPPIGRTFQ
jgi:transitional endoplasmic reticulum ATPase